MADGKSGPKRTVTQREKDLLDTSRLYLAGHYQADIAQMLGVSQQQISLDLRTLRGRWLKASVANIDEMKSRELARIDRLEVEYWDAWRRSLEQFKAETLKAKNPNIKREEDKESPSSVEKWLRTEDRNGDPRYLAGVQWCIDRRCKLLGLDAPQKVAPVNPEGTGEYSGGLVILPAKGGDGATVQGNGQ